MTIAAYPKYESYHDSGVEWVGAIPVSWNVWRGKRLFKKMDRPVRPEDDIVTCFRDGVVTLRANRRTEGFTNALKEHGYQGIRKGDLVIHAMDAFAGAVGVSDSDGKSTPVYSACVPRVEGAVNSRFYAYYMRHIALSGLLVAMAKGIRERSTDFRFGDFADLALAAPPIEEQTAIVTFLDGKCARIDEAVRIKEEQIRLLAERRQILIQQAVTRGLNPDAPMKDSGIDWIGQIPAHWEVKRFKSVATACGRIGFRGYGTTDLVNKGEGAVTLSPSNLSDGLMQFEKCSYISWKKYQESPEIQVEEGDVLVVKTGSTFGKTGFVRKLPEPATINPQLVVLKKIKCDSEFLYHLISSSQFQAEVKRRVIGSTIPTISESRLLGIDLQIPPRDEQNEIIDHIAAVSDQINAVIALKESQITALREYKTSLINAAVTGKIKVF